MNDRKMLEFAAKAAGISGVYETGVIWYKNPFGDDAGFNPLNDDGDALRLATKCGITVDMHLERVRAYADESGTAEEFFGSDPDAATRRAITRAAAAIGEKMP